MFVWMSYKQKENETQVSSFKNKNTISYLGNLYKNIDKEIENSLTGQLLQSLGSFSKKNFHTWVNTTFSQIAICTLCLIFTNEISNLLADETSKEKIPLKEYNLINQKYKIMKIIIFLSNPK